MADPFPHDFLDDDHPPTQTNGEAAMPQDSGDHIPGMNGASATINGVDGNDGVAEHWEDEFNESSRSRTRYTTQNANEVFDAEDFEYGDVALNDKATRGADDLDTMERHTPMQRVALGDDDCLMDDANNDPNKIAYRKRGSNTIIIMLLLLAIVFPLIIVWKESKNLRNKAPVALPSDSGNGDEDEDLVKPLAPVPDNIHVLCSTDYINKSARARQQCEEICEVADCCNFPSSLDLSCINGNHNKCLQYHQFCVVLNQDVTTTSTGNGIDAIVPEAPIFLPDLCSKDSVTSAYGESAFTLCQQACEAGKCCYDKSGSTLSCTPHQNCQNYSPCLEMDALDHVSTKISKEVNERCSLSNILNVEGRDQCIDACSHSLCCFAQDIVGPCPNDNPEQFCSQYQACTNVFDVTKEQINAFCDPEDGDSGTCRHLCTPARCCFNQGECFNDVTMDNCDMYQSCKTIFDTQITGTTDIGTTNTQATQTICADDDDVCKAKRSVDQKCAQQNVLTIDGRDSCIEACEPSLCCYAPDIVGACSQSKGEEYCTTYTSCANVFNVSKQQVDHFCNPNTGDKGTCQHLCSPGNCCFDKGECFSGVTLADCDLYQSCSAITTIADTGDICADGDSCKIKKNIDETCSHQNVLTVNGRDSCIEACEPSLCCYAPDVVGACSQDRANFCASYTSCSNVFNVSKEQVDHFCHPVIGDTKTCNHFCSPANCCFDKGECFSGITKDDCNLYQSCEIRSDNLDKIICDPNDAKCRVKKNVDTKCDPSNVLTVDGRDNCIEVCEPSLCCYAQDIVGMCSASKGDDYCTQYNSCANVFTVTKLQIDTFCSEVSGNNHVCHQLCTPARCCFGKGECFDDVSTDDCDLYESCSSYFDKNDDCAYNDAACETKNSVDAKCSLSNVLTVDGRNSCIDACEDSLCCYAPHVVGACPGDKGDDFCSRYSSCVNVYNVSKQQIDHFCHPTLGDNTTCSHLCSPANCCFGKGSCFSGITLDDCDKYQSCGGSSADKTIQVNNKCDVEKILTVSGRNQCIEICEDSLCCYAADIVGSCAANNHGDENFCVQYSSCENVFKVTKIQVDKFCDPVFGDHNTCLHLCAQAKCCFDQGDCLNSVTKDNCETFESCTAVFGDNDSSSSISTSGGTSSGSQNNNAVSSSTSSQNNAISLAARVNDACLNHNNDATTHTGKTLCEEVCEAGSCCFDKNSDCDKSVDCVAYQPCKDATLDLNKACNDNAYAIDRTLCVQLCVKASCCYTTDPVRSCYETNISIVCAEYSAACDKVFLT